ncbi:Uncharacterised protein [Amycolatopsis camponoti]|uniref:Uncharacterized protein n=1 Tax=Amycolatopsis camponoti TaxID=2606593 RepID=A0A6I8LJJ7_9PSEU|nr:hypothetical protein [Amycolatopsis camponoti]VVJ16147.1 Uncharacterised protein [Amycolatopsis camponoti]
MITRALTGLAAAAVIGTLGAPLAAAAPATAAAAVASDGGPAVRPPGQCVWIWTGGPPQCKKLE